ncbi:MAG: VCBS repeat-containing protein [Pirellulales bacterium]
MLLSRCSERIAMRVICGVVVIAIGTLLHVGCTQKPSVSTGGSSKSGSVSQFKFELQELSEDTASITYRNGEEGKQYSILESLGGGVGLVDYDQDGNLDVWLAGGGSLSDHRITPGNCSLLRNCNGQRFVNVHQVLPESTHYNHGVSVADYDNDGFPDLLITGYGGIQLLMNQGDGTFSDATHNSHLIQDELWSSSAAWGDFNSDGFVDLYVAHYVNWSFDTNPHCNAPFAGQRDVCSPNEFQALNHSFFLSLADGTFEETSSRCGLVEGGKGLGVIAADLNEDGHLDLYVANDTTANFLYKGDGSGHFEELALIAGVAVDGSGAPNGSMGICLWDFDNDLRPDLWVTNYENESIAAYQNRGNMMFGWVSEKMGLAAIGRSFVGFGIVSGDFDGDGDEDIVVTNGHVIQFPANSTLDQIPLLFENSGTLRMAKQSFPSNDYFAKKHRGRGVVRGDIDNNGSLDLVFSHVNEPPVILVNRSETRTLKLRLIGSQCNRDCIGTSITLETDKNKYARWISGGGSYLSQNPYEQYWCVAKGERPIRFHIQLPNTTEKQVVQIDNDVMTLVF